MATWSEGSFNDEPEQSVRQQPEASSILPSMGQVDYGGPKPADSQGHYFNIQDTARKLSGYTPPPSKEFDWQRQSQQTQQRIAMLRQRAAVQRRKNAQIRLANSPIRLPNMNFTLGASGGGGGPRFRRFVNAISGQESGGNYRAVNPDSGAAGKYQIMPSNFAGPGGWDKQALGRDISLQKYLNSPKLQEKIARHKLREYYSKYGARGAASAWYSGDPNKWRNTSSQGSYPSIARYVQMIMRRMKNG